MIKRIHRKKNSHRKLKYSIRNTTKIRHTQKRNHTWGRLLTSLPSGVTADIMSINHDFEHKGEPKRNQTWGRLLTTLPWGVTSQLAWQLPWPPWCFPLDDVITHLPCRISKLRRSATGELRHLTMFYVHAVPLIVSHKTRFLNSMKTI